MKALAGLAERSPASSAGRCRRHPAPCSRMRLASRVKSLSELTRTKPSKRPECIRSMASITSAISDAFLAHRVGRLMMRHDAELGLHTGPALHVARGKIPVDCGRTLASPKLAIFVEDCARMLVGRVVRVDQNRQEAGCHWPSSRIPPAPACHSAPARARAHASLPPGSSSFPPGRPCRCRCGRAQPPPSASRHRRSASWFARRRQPTVSPDPPPPGA